MAEAESSPAETRKSPVKWPPQSPEQKSLAAKARWARVYREKKPPLTQALEIQECLYDVGLAMMKDVKSSEDKADRARSASVLAGVAKGWQSIQDQIRILKGKPLPGSLRPQSEPKSKKKNRDSVVPIVREESKESLIPLDPSPHSHTPEGGEAPLL